MPNGLLELTREQRQLARVLLRQRGVDPTQLPIPRRPDPSVAPLSVTQQRLWMSGQVAKGLPYGNVPMGFRIHGGLDPDALEQALSLVVARHEILRTTFPVENRRATQRIHPATEIAVPEEDLRSVPVSEREDALKARIVAEARRPFDPASETLLRATLFRLDSDDWGLVIVSNHLATDGWGARLLLDELSLAYQALGQGRQPELPPLPIQYGDYAAWEVERLDSGELESQRAYWLARLAGAPAQLRLPFDGAPSRSLETESIAISLSPALSDRVRKASRAEGVTPYITLLAAFGVLLQRQSGQDDIVIGTIMSRRTRSETEPLIGNFGNNLLLRTRLDGDPSARDILRRTASTVREALANSDVSLELVAQSASIPAFHVMFLVRDGNFEERLTIGDAVSAIGASPRIATLDMVLDLTDGARGINGYLEFRTARFTRERMERLASDFESVVTELTGDLHGAAEPRSAPTG
ncbi:MAG TPA: condensation domain-containing protein [Gemmatimonadaceae bacterium]|nr:condensation domain-containing protein [Gemmatimonadaceae bacterium]